MKTPIKGKQQDIKMYVSKKKPHYLLSKIIEKDTDVEKELKSLLKFAEDKVGKKCAKTDFIYREIKYRLRK